MIEEIKSILKEYELKELLNLKMKERHELKSINCNLYLDNGFIAIYERGSGACELMMKITAFKKKYKI